MSIPFEINPCLFDCEVTHTAIGQDVYMIRTNDDSVSKDENLAIVMGHSSAIKLLSKEAIATGHIDGDCLYWNTPYRSMIPLYELLEKRIITDYDVIRMHDTQELWEDGQYFCPDYFGELKKADKSRAVKLRGYERVSNGIDAFLYIDGGVELAIHRVAAEYELSDEAIALSVEHDCHCHFQNESCAVALYELTDTYPALNELVNDRKEMINILRSYFSAYLISRGLFQ